MFSRDASPAVILFEMTSYRRGGGVEVYIVKVFVSYSTDMSLGLLSPIVELQDARLPVVVHSKELSTLGSKVASTPLIALPGHGSLLPAPVKHIAGRMLAENVVGQISAAEAFQKVGNTMAERVLDHPNLGTTVMAESGPATLAKGIDVKMSAASGSEERVGFMALQN